MLNHYHDNSLINKIMQQIHDVAKDINKEKIRICHVCGTHEYTISHHGIRSLLPSNVEVISGPGCPVCVCPTKDIAHAIWLSQNGYTVTTFGDMSRVPTPYGSLLQAAAQGGSVKVVYSFMDTLRLAKENPDEKYVFFSIGFETTAPMVAIELINNNLPPNLFILSSHRLVPPALHLLMTDPEIALDGFIGPGHVSVIIGLNPYKPISQKYNIPIVIAGFEPLDVLLGILAVLSQIKKGEGKVENVYPQTVREEGNVIAQKALSSAYKIVDADWRGIGTIPKSGYELHDKFNNKNIRLIEDLPVINTKETMPKGCRCADVILGKITPKECPLFLTKCLPESPVGPCMVSDEGTCQIHAKYGSYVSF